VRPWIFPYAAASITVGLAGLVLALAGDHVDSTIAGYVGFAAMAFLVESNFSFPLLEAPLPVPSGATVRPSKALFGYWTLTTGVLLVLLTPAAVFDVVVRDEVGLVISVCASPLGLGVNSLIRRVVRWENEHRVEFLRTRWRGGTQELYVRSRSTADGDHAAQAPSGPARRESQIEGDHPA